MKAEFAVRADSKFGSFFVLADRDWRLVSVTDGSPGVPLRAAFPEGSEAAEALSALLGYLDSPLTLDASDWESAAALRSFPEDFRRVWLEAASVPCGGTETAQDAAALLGISLEAVKEALRANPLLCLIPAHRITEEGRPACGTELSSKLLEHETGPGTRWWY